MITYSGIIYCIITLLQLNNYECFIYKPQLTPQLIPQLTRQIKSKTSVQSQKSSISKGEIIYLEQFLLSSLNDKPSLIPILYTIFDSCREISYKIKTASCTKMACYNQFGEEQLAIDILANNLLMSTLKNCANVNCISSEEEPVVIKVKNEPDPNGYSVSFDPLDGSSIVDCNLAVGTIFSIWKGNELTNIYGNDIQVSGMCIYGPRTIMTFAVNELDGVYEFLLNEYGQWIASNYYCGMMKNGHIYSPGNIRALNSNPGYKQLLDYWIKHNYQLRYSGGMVAEVNQLLVKGTGIFVNVASKTVKPKLRMLYEVAPLGFLVEKAGGKTSDGIQSVLNILIENTNQTSQLAFGSENDVEMFNNLVGKLYL